MRLHRDIYWEFSKLFATKKEDLGRALNPRLEYFGRWNDVESLRIKTLFMVMSDIEQALIEDF